MRFIKQISWIITTVVTGFLLFGAYSQLLSDDSGCATAGYAGKAPHRSPAAFLTGDGEQVDTLFTTSPCFLHIMLDSQLVYCHWNDGRTDRYVISSGNSRLTKGIATPVGIYCIQSKASVQISKQFNDTKMLWWMQFDGNIGFHGLEGRGYYRTLGVRPSSHGCVRMSQEDAKHLFETVPVGAPVLVTAGDTASRRIGFARDFPVDSLLHLTSDEVREYYDFRIAVMHEDEGRYETLPIVPLIKDYVKKSGLDITHRSRKSRGMSQGRDAFAIVFNDSRIH